MLSDSLHRVKHSLARTNMVCLFVTLHLWVELVLKYTTVTMRTWMMFYRDFQSFCVFTQDSLKLERLDQIVTLSLILILRGPSHERKIHITREVKRSDLTWIGACGSNPPPNLGGTERKVWDHISGSVHSPRHTHTPHRDILNVLCCKHPQLREQCPASRCVSGGKVAGSSCTSADTHKIKLQPPVDARIP